MGVRELKRKKLRIRVKDKGERKETCERVAVERRTNGQKVETDQKGEEEVGGGGGRGGAAAGRKNEKDLI